ncbi:MAG: hypothetical protein DRN26_04070 [Thermoplasmata archaeon]|nr:MAG: hypothetical protein DRN26_04070 [Thermoplasmata archaeon]
MNMRTYYVPLKDLEELPGKLVWFPHLVLRSSRGRYLVNAFFVDKVEYSPRKALLIRSYPKSTIPGEPSFGEIIVRADDIDPDRIIDDLNAAYIDSLEIAKSKAYHRAKFLGRHNLKRIILIPTGFVRALSKDDSLAEEFREASYGAMIMRETIFWLGERPTAEEIIYIPMILEKRGEEILIFDQNLNPDRIFSELMKKERAIYDTIKKIVDRV